MFQDARHHSGQWGLSRYGDLAWLRQEVRGQLPQAAARNKCCVAKVNEKNLRTRGRHYSQIFSCMQCFTTQTRINHTCSQSSITGTPVWVQLNIRAVGQFHIHLYSVAPQVEDLGAVVEALLAGLRVRSQT